MTGKGEQVTGWGEAHHLHHLLGLGGDLSSGHVRGRDLVHGLMVVSWLSHGGLMVPPWWSDGGLVVEFLALETRKPASLACRQFACPQAVFDYRVILLTVPP